MTIAARRMPADLSNPAMLFPAHNMDELVKKLGEIRQNPKEYTLLYSRIQPGSISHVLYSHHLGVGHADERVLMTYDPDDDTRVWW